MQCTLLGLWTLVQMVMIVSLLDQIPFGTFTKQLCKVTSSLFVSGHPSVNME